MAWASWKATLSTDSDHIRDLQTQIRARQRPFFAGFIGFAILTAALAVLSASGAVAFAPVYAVEFAVGVLYLAVAIPAARPTRRMMIEIGRERAARDWRSGFPSPGTSSPQLTSLRLDELRRRLDAGQLSREEFDRLAAHAIVTDRDEEL